MTAGVASADVLPLVPDLDAWRDRDQSFETRDFRPRRFKLVV